MATIEQMMQDFVNKDYEELVALGSIAVKNLLPVCKKVDEEHDGFMMLSAIVLSAIGADGKLSALEVRFLGDVMGLDEDAVANFIKLYDSRYEELVDQFADALSAEVKADVVMLVMSIAACDEKISREENAFIQKILA